jgi:spermidine/putrescine transport system ATP-binding protein
MAMSDRIAVMGEGGILQIATPTELYHRPRTRAVAEFIGSINFVPVDAISATGPELKLDAGRLGSFVLRTETAPAPAAPALLALRPEDLVIHDECPPNGVNAISGEIEEHVFLGDRSFLRVRVEGRKEPMIAAYHRDRDCSSAKPGNPVWLGWERTRGRLLPDA